MVDNIFANIAKSLPEELFETLVKNQHVHIERIVSFGHKTAEDEWYDQQKSEWVMLLKGAAKIKFENSSVTELKPGDYINIPAHKKHRVDWTDENNETVWLAVFY